MRPLLLDTHALLWWYTEPERLPAQVRGALANRERPILVSSVSAYEIALKNRIGKLPHAERLVSEFADAIEQDRFDELPVTNRHGIVAGRLDPSYRDPFDRLLIAQALTENLVLASNEEPFDRFGVERLWA